MKLNFTKKNIVIIFILIVFLISFFSIDHIIYKKKQKHYRQNESLLGELSILEKKKRKLKSNSSLYLVHSEDLLFQEEYRDSIFRILNQQNLEILSIRQEPIRGIKDFISVFNKKSEKTIKIIKMEINFIADFKVTYNFLKLLKKEGFLFFSQSFDFEIIDYPKARVLMVFYVPVYT